MKIEITVIFLEHDGLYSAYDADAVDYDWDGSRCVALHPEGFGKTKKDAIINLLDEMELLEC